eukprot:20434-Heterococcus_DN1.PRE.1
MSETIDQVLLPEQAAAAASESVVQEEYVRGLFQSLLVATRASNSLPGPDDFAFQSTYAEFVKHSGRTQAQVVDILHTLLDHVLGGDNTLDLGAADSVNDPAAFQALSDVVDGLLEEVDEYLDEQSQKRAYKQSELMDSLQDGDTTAAAGSSRSQALMCKLNRGQKLQMMARNSTDMPKPQLAFLDDIDNDRDSPFVPKLTEKPHAIAALDLRLVPVVDSSSSSAADYDSDSMTDTTTSAATINANAAQLLLEQEGYSSYCPHPYAAEIAALQPQQWQLAVPVQSELVVPQAVLRAVLSAFSAHSSELLARLVMGVPEQLVQCMHSVKYMLHLPLAAHAQRSAQLAQAWQQDELPRPAVPHAAE